MHILIAYNPSIRSNLIHFSFFFFTRTARSKFIIYTYTLLAASIFLELSSEELASRDDHARRRRRRGRTARRNIALRKGYVYFATVFLFARVPAKFRPIDTDLYGSISRLFLSLLEHVPSLGFDRADPLLPWDLLLQRNSLCVYIYIYMYRGTTNARCSWLRPNHFKTGENFIIYVGVQSLFVLRGGGGVGEERG